MILQLKNGVWYAQVSGTASGGFNVGGVVAAEIGVVAAEKLVNNYTLPQYLYTGTVTGLVNDTIRNDPNQIRITYEGTYLPKPRPFLLPGFISNS